MFFFSRLCLAVSLNIEIRSIIIIEILETLENCTACEYVHMCTIAYVEAANTKMSHCK